MNTKAAIGIIVAIIILVVAFFVLNHPKAPAVFVPTTATSTQGTATTTGGVKVAPGNVVNTAPASHKPTITYVRTSEFDPASLISSSPRPVITGTANVSSVGIVITNSAGVGISGSYEIPVKNGKWSYSAPQALAPGLYTLSLIDGGDVVTATLVVKAP